MEGSKKKPSSIQADSSRGPGNEARPTNSKYFGPSYEQRGGELGKGRRRKKRPAVVRS